MTGPTIRAIALTVAGLCLTADNPRTQQVRDAVRAAVGGSGQITGGVLTHGASPVPVRRARVTLNSDDRRVGFTTATDDQGRFRFTALPAGRFALQATKPGHLPAPYGAVRPGRAGTSVGLGEGQQIDDLVIRMARGSVIAGVVRDHRGEPMPGANVLVLRYAFAPLTGERTLLRANSSTADDRGMYRIFELPPGQYVVLARPTGIGLDEIVPITSDAVQRLLQLAGGGPGATAAAGAARPIPGADRPVSYAPVFHPGSPDLSRAETITLGLADERLDVDLALELVRTARITVRFTAPDGIAPESVSIEIVRSGPDGELLGQLGTVSPFVRLGREWTYTLPGVPPGRFTIEASTDRYLRNPKLRRVWGEADVIVDGRDQEIAIALQHGVTVSGRVLFDGTSPLPDMANLEFFLTQGAGGALNAGGPGGELDAEGRFSFPDVTPGRYALTWVRRGPATAWAIATATAAGRDVLDTRLDVRPGQPIDLVVTFTDRPTQLGGRLQDVSGRAAPDYFIIVFTADRSFWTPASRRVRMIRPATDGAFATVGLPPGEYFIGALLDVERGEWYDPRFLEALAKASVKVALRAGETTTQDLRVGR